jgi:hypothetical protein
VAPFKMKRTDARDRVKEAVPTRLEDAPSQTKHVRRTIVAFERVEDYVAEIETLWKEAAETFLLIGRNLNKAKEILPHGEYQRMVQSCLPFDKSRAYQLRMVATMVDSGRVAEDDLPRSSATAFLFASLDREMIARAKDDGILRADVRRQEVQEWKRRLAGPPPNAVSLARMRATLRARIQRYEDELARAREQLAELGDDLPRSVIIDGHAEDAAAK